MTSGSYWAVAQTVTKMEHIVRREIEKTNRGAFVPTYARHWKVDGRKYVKEYPLLGGYVFFLTQSDDWAGIPDIHGVYDVLTRTVETHRGVERFANRVTDLEMKRLMMSHAIGLHNRTDHAKFTKYYRPAPSKRKNSRKPRPGNRLRNFAAA